jgi:hypothetical protein
LGALVNPIHFIAISVKITSVQNSSLKNSV